MKKSALKNTEITRGHWCASLESRNPLSFLGILWPGTRLSASSGPTDSPVSTWVF